MSNDKQSRPSPESSNVLYDHKREVVAQVRLYMEELQTFNSAAAARVDALIKEMEFKGNRDGYAEASADHRALMRRDDDEALYKRGVEDGVKQEHDRLQQAIKNAAAEP
jgi:hypothetical protein